MPYRCALYRGLARHGGVDWTVWFLDSWGYEQRYDPTMNATYSWGEETLADFKCKFLVNKGRFKVTYTGADRTIDEQTEGWIGTLRFYLRTYFGLLNPGVVREMWRSNASVVIVENYSSISSVAAALVARLRGKQVFLRGEATFRSDQSRLFRVLKQLYLRILFPIFSGFMYSCSANRSFYRAHGVVAHKLVFVPSAVDETVFGETVGAEPEKIRRQLRESYGISSDAIVILGIGRLVPRKNWEETLNSFKLARQQDDRLILVIAGDGPSRPDLERDIGDDLRRSVHFLGFKSQIEIAQLYFMGDFLVQSSLYDPSPKVLNEGLLAGLPLVVSDRVGTAGDVCVDGKNGFVYSSGCVHELRDKFLRLAQDAELRRCFSQGSRELSNVWSINHGVQNIVEAVNGGPKMRTQR